MKPIPVPRSVEPRPAQQPKWWLRSLRLIRRVHLYLGLLLMPWVLLFAITALSFNHPGMWRDLQGSTLSPERVRELVGFQPWDADVIAERVATAMGATPSDAVPSSDAATPSDAAGTGTEAGGVVASPAASSPAPNAPPAERGGYEVVPGSASFHGWALFARPAPEGQRVVILALDRGEAFLSTRPPTSESAKPPFFGERVSLPEHNTEALAKVLEPIHADDLGADAAPLRPHPRIRPELRFLVRDDRGDSWNVVYDLGTGLLDGRPTQEVSSTPTIELLESLHKQHHYPPSFAASSVWALFADLTAITLLFWCLSGLLMWWQMKKLRWVGASLLVLAVVVATLVMTSTAAEITFPPERAEGPTAPGGAPPGAFAQGLVEASRGV